VTEQSFMIEKLNSVEENFKRIKNEVGEAAVRAGRSAEEIRLMAVTKTVEPVFINRAIACGADLIGENRVQEFLSKKDGLDLDRCEAHLIGHLQTNKVRQIVGEVSLIQSVDSVKLAKEIGRCSVNKNIVSDILLEVNIGGEDSKFGFLPSEVYEKACEISETEGIKICGLMTVPPFDATKEQTSTFFSNMRQLFIDIGEKKIHNVSMSVLSMGMSGDYREAIAAGSTLVRVGTAIFGSRQYN
jgi:pyridoxal phosphate enzyme (YggS family)